MRILITGATGLIGSHITRLCKEKGFEVNYLTTSKNKIEKTPGYQGFYWDPETGELDEKSLQDVDAIIHLAGATIAKRWTSSYKKEIIDSRIKTADLLFTVLQRSSVKIPHFISASGISVYPSSYEKLYTEEEKAVDDNFIAGVVKVWETAADQFKELGMEVTKVRTGLVLAGDDGALPKMAKPVSLNAGAALGSGRQWQSWIHVEDLAGIYCFLVEHQLGGVYNAVAPNPVTNKELMENIAKELDKSIILPNVPGFALKLAMGEMATVVLASQRVSSVKIQDAGFNFNYINLPKALDDLL